MSLRSSCPLFSFFFILAFGCSDAAESEGLPETEEAVNSEQDEPARNAPPRSSAEEVDEGFDACPEDTYHLWSGNGRSHEVRIQVFCEPIMLDINLGRPVPFVGEQDN